MHNYRYFSHGFRFYAPFSNCVKAQEVLDAQQISIATVIDARKQRFDAEAVWELFRKAESIITGKGNKVTIWDPKTADKQSVLKQIMGPSGNLRAPTLRYGAVFLVGFNPEMYERYILRVQSLAQLVGVYATPCTINSFRILLGWGYTVAEPYIR